MKTKAGRRLKATSYLDGIATSGVCECCGRKFEANTDAGLDISEAIRDFLSEFENHDCLSGDSFPRSDKEHGA